MNTVFLETFVGEQTILHRIDPRVKTIFVLATLGVVLTTTQVIAPLAVTILGSALLALMPVPGRYLAIRTLPALWMAAIVMLTQVLLQGSTPIFSMHIGSVSIVGYQEGWDKGLLITARILSGMSMLMLLTVTTSVDKLLFALAWMKVPHSLVEMGTLAYRYIFVFMEQIGRVYKAQCGRLGYRNWRTALQAGGVLGGIVIIRAIDQSSRLYTAMRCRGYQGNIAVTYNQPFLVSDLLASIILASIWGALLYIAI